MLLPRFPLRNETARTPGRGEGLCVCVCACVGGDGLRALVLRSVPLQFEGDGIVKDQASEVRLGSGEGACVSPPSPSFVGIRGSRIASLDVSLAHIGKLAGSFCTDPDPAGIPRCCGRVWPFGYFAMAPKKAGPNAGRSPEGERLFWSFPACFPRGTHFCVLTDAARRRRLVNTAAWAVRRAAFSGKPWKPMLQGYFSLALTHLVRRFAQVFPPPLHLIQAMVRPG